MKAEKYKYVLGGIAFDRSRCNTVRRIYLRRRVCARQLAFKFNSTSDSKDSSRPPARIDGVQTDQLPLRHRPEYFLVLAE